jgi:hypothetical protein
MNEVDRLFIAAVELLRMLEPRYRHFALYASEFWSDERIAQGIGGAEAAVDAVLPDNEKPPRPSLRVVKGD